MLIELQKVLSQELKCLCREATSPIGNNHTRNYGCESLTFLSIRNKYIAWKCVLLRNVYSVYTVARYCSGLYVCWWYSYTL